MTIACAPRHERSTTRPAAVPLHGVPVAVKDLIDTADLPTAYGSDIYRDHRPDRDAACVARLREAGGLIMGKTVTNEFAYSRPVATRNPRNLTYVPGGSSGGSAAAVADGMVPRRARYPDRRLDHRPRGLLRSDRLQAPRAARSPPGGSNSWPPRSTRSASCAVPSTISRR